MIYNPSNWYWVVANSSTQVYSSSIGDYVLVSNPTYQAWLASGNTPSRISTEVDLGGVLANTNAIKPINTNILTAWQTALANGVNQAIFKVLFNHENRIRVLEGKSTITVQQAIAGFAALM